MRNYRLWAWISLIISIIFALITFLNIKNQKEKEREYGIKLYRYEMEKKRQVMEKKRQVMGTSKAPNKAYDTNKDYYAKKYEEVFFQFDIEYKMKEEDFREYDTNRYFIQHVMKYEYDKMVNRYAEEYKIDPDIIRLVYPSPYVDDENEPSNEEVSRNEDRDSYKSDEIERPAEPQDNGFDKVSGAASILGLFFTFYFRYSDKKGKQKAKEGKIDKKIEHVDTALRDAEISGSKGDKRREENVDKEKNENTEVVEAGTNSNNKNNGEKIDGCAVF